MYLLNHVSQLVILGVLVTAVFKVSLILGLTLVAAYAIYEVTEYKIRKDMLNQLSLAKELMELENDCGGHC